MVVYAMFSAALIYPLLMEAVGCQVSIGGSRLLDDLGGAFARRARRRR